MGARSKAKVVVVGEGDAAVTACLALANAGIAVHHLIEGNTLPAGNWDQRPDRIAVTQHPQVDTRLQTRVREAARTDNGWRVLAEQVPQYVDWSRCTACGLCEQTCPVTLVNSNGKRSHAITRGETPTTYHIQKLGTAPCRDACPVHQHAQGYVALIREKRYLDAYYLIRADNPFPSLCGRICNHYCEQECTRNRVDEPVAVMALKRFVADWAYEHRDQLPPKSPPSVPISGKRVAVVGAGPAGLTAALDLVRAGHAVTVFDKLPVAGGMLRVGVPSFRLPHHLIEWELQLILNEGVELCLNTQVDDVNDLLVQGYDAVFLAVGAHKARVLPIPGHDMPDVSTSLAFLKKVNLGEPVDLERQRILVLGGGNVAIDVARTALRHGALEVSMTCLEGYEQMPASPWELHAAQEEGIQVYPSRTFREITAEHGRVNGVRCVQVDFRGFVDGRPDMDEIPNSDHVLPADVVYFAIGQYPDLGLLPADGMICRTSAGTIVADERTKATAQPGVFAGADCVKGAMFFAIDAIAAGHDAAHSIDAYLRGQPIGIPESAPATRAALNDGDITARIETWGVADHARIPVPEIPVIERLRGDFEVELGYDEQMALREADRCLRCGICSECLSCSQVCPANAIDHNADAHFLTFDADAVICANSITIPGALRVARDDTSEALKVATRLIRDLQPAMPVIPEYASPRSANRVGVFLCRCGGVISDVIDQDMIHTTLNAQFDVPYVQTVDFACHPNGASGIREAMSAQGLDRAVLAACSCCALDQVCTSCSSQRMRCKTQLLREAQLSMDFVNVREHVALVQDAQNATLVALDLIAVALARTQMLGTDWPGLVTANIDRNRCRDCGDCVDICQHDVLRVDQNGKVAVVVDESRCVGCGACAAVCPTGAMNSGNTSDAAIEAMLNTMDLTGKVVVFSCNWGAYTGPELAGIHRATYAHNVRLIRLMCASRSHAGLILKTFVKGAAGILMLACPPEGCHYQTDSRARFEQSTQLVELLGIAPERLQLAHLEAGDMAGFLEIVNRFTDSVSVICDEMTA